MHSFVTLVLRPTCSDADTDTELMASMAVAVRIILGSLRTPTKSKTSDM